MYSPDGMAVPPQRLRVMQIIAGALILGVVNILVVFLIIRSLGNPLPPPQVPILTYVGIIFAAACLVGHFLIPARIAATSTRQIRWEDEPTFSTVQSSVKKPPEDRKAQWLAVYQMRMIVAMALLEGAAFYQAIAYFVEGQALALGLAGLLVVGLVLQFPTRSRLERWLQIQDEQVQQEG